MRLLEPITATTRDVVEACLSPRINRINRAKIIRDDLLQIEMDVDAFDHHISRSQTRHYVPAEFDTEIKDALIWLYERRFKTGDASHIRDAILTLGVHGCPYCHSPYAPTIDHMFPKATHPRLAVTPRNLIPACRDCNTERNGRSNRIDVDPYSDAWVEQESWLRAEIPDAKNPDALVFSIDYPLAWTVDQRSALSDLATHARFFYRFTLSASQEFRSRRVRFAHIYQAGGSAALLDAFETELKVHHTRSINYWASAAYKCWATSNVDWGEVFY